jgi:hypothetical protein
VITCDASTADMPWQSTSSTERRKSPTFTPPHPRRRHAVRVPPFAGGHHALPDRDVRERHRVEYPVAHVGIADGADVVGPRRVDGAEVIRGPVVGARARGRRRRIAEVDVGPGGGRGEGGGGGSG